MIRNGEGWKGWLAAVFFGICTLAFLITLIPGSSYLKLNTENFEVCSLFRKHEVRWDSVSEFGVFRLEPGGTFVGYNFRPGAEHPSGIRRFNQGLSGYEAGLPDTYGMKPDELAEVLNAERMKNG